MWKIMIVFVLVIGGVYYTTKTPEIEKAYTLLKEGQKEEAHLLFKKLCKEDNYKACMEVGNKYSLEYLTASSEYLSNVYKYATEGIEYKNIKMDKNKIERLRSSALEYYKKACDNDIESACGSYDNIANKIIGK